VHKDSIVAKLTAYGNVPLLKWHYKDEPRRKYCLRSDGKLLRKWASGGWSLSTLTFKNHELTLDEKIELIKNNPNVVVIK
jgi:hypothetical protein